MGAYMGALADAFELAALEPAALEPAALKSAACAGLCVCIFVCKFVCVGTGTTKSYSVQSGLRRTAVK